MLQWGSKNNTINIELKKVMNLWNVFIFVLVVALLILALYKPSIHEATIDDLTQIEGIGTTLAEKIVNYTRTHPNCNVDDLINIQGIGPTKLIELRKKYR